MKRKKTNNAVGVKGKSGRKSGYEEHYKTRAINTLWKKVCRKVEEGKELSDYEKDLVKSILPKTIKTESGLDVRTPEQLLVKIIGKDG
jgi:hypothetical protein